MLPTGCLSSRAACIYSPKFCLNLRKRCAATIEILQKAFVDMCTGKTQITEWYKRLKIVAHILTQTHDLADLQ